MQNEQPTSSTQQHQRGVEAEEDRDRDHSSRRKKKRGSEPVDEDAESSSSSARRGIHKQSTANHKESTSTNPSNNCGGSGSREDASAEGSGGDGGGSGSDGSASDRDRSSQRGADHIGVGSNTVPAPVSVGSMPLSNVENCNETQLRVRAILTYMRLISRPKSIRQRVREGLLRWVKVRAEEVNQQKRVDELRESRGEAPSASTRHSSTTFKPAPKILKRKEVIRENKGQTQTRTKIGKRIAVINERMGAISKRIAQREKRGDG